MNYTNIATILNNQLVHNAEGVAVTVAEDLSNIVDFGTAIANLSADDLKDLRKKLVVGVSNWVLSRLIESNRFKMLRDATQFGGGLQRILASENFTAQESHLLNLVSDGTSYHDGKFYGMSESARVYTNTETFKVVHSVAEDFEKQMFMNAEDTAKWFGLVEVTERNSIIQKVNELEKRVIIGAIKNAHDGNRVVHLITLFNGMMGLSGTDAYTIATLKKDRDAWAYFASFAKECMARIVDYVKEPNRKYNNGEVLTYTPTSDVACVMISQFANDIKFLANPIEFKAESVNVSYDTVASWQNFGVDMLPDYSVTSKITLVDGESTETIDDVVAVVYDVLSVGATTVQDKVTVEPVGAEGFINYHHHLAMRYYSDPRLASVIFALD